MTDRAALLRRRAVDAAAAASAASVAALAVLASGYFSVLVLPVALGVGVLLVRGPGRSRWVGAGVLLGLAAVVFVILLETE